MEGRAARMCVGVKGVPRRDGPSAIAVCCRIRKGLELAGRDGLELYLARRGSTDLAFSRLGREV